jgi:hypothetical protein
MAKKIDLMTIGVVAALIIGVLAITGTRIGGIETDDTNPVVVKKTFHQVCGLHKATQATGTDMLTLSGFGITPAAYIPAFNSCAWGYYRTETPNKLFGILYTPGDNKVPAVASCEFDGIQCTNIPQIIDVQFAIPNACEDLFVSPCPGQP